MGWRQFAMDLETLEPERVEEVFSRHGALAVTLSNAGVDPVLEPAPGETPLWNDTRISGLFGADTDLEPLKDDLRASFGLIELPRSSIERLADRAWEREWLKDFAPLRFGRRLWISPRDAEVAAEGAVVMRLDPGLAFGTGNHPTTAMCLQWIDSIAIEDKRVLDVGCGSGILAICALLMGAASATALDVDRQAITATLDNAAANGVSGRLATARSAAEVDGQFDVVLANILAEPLIELAPTLVTLLGAAGLIGLSGILAEQADAVRAAYAQWIAFEPPVVTDGWVRLTGIRR